MTPEWRTLSLGELCELRAGTVFKPEFQGNASGDYPFIKVSDMNLAENSVRIRSANHWVSEQQRSMLKAKPFPPGTTVFAKIGEALRQNRLRLLIRDTLIDNNMMGAVPKAALVDPTFFFYALSQFDFINVSAGTALPYLTIEALSRLQIELPSLPEQRAISRVLGSLDEKLELNRRMNETLEAIAQTLFRSWFMEQMTSGWLSETSVESLFNQGILQVGDGYRAKNDELGSTGLPFARAGNIDNGFSFEGADHLREESVLKAGDKVSRPFDVVFTSKGTVGRFAFVDPSMSRFVYSPQLCFWRSLDHSRLNPFVLQQWMQSRWFSEQVDRVKGQTDMAEYVSLRDQRKMKLLLPPGAAQSRVSDALAPLQQRVWNNVAESKTLADCRDLLLPRLLSGELSVRHAEHIVEATA